MKKVFLNLFLLIVGAAVISSCKKDDDTPTTPPTVSFLNSTGTATVAAGDSATVTIVVNEGGEKLNQLSVTQNGNNYGGFNGGVPKDISGSSVQETVSLAAPSQASSSLDYVIIATDKKGNQGTATFTVKSEAPATTPLSSASTIQFQRNCSATATGLSNYGLAWTSNSSTSAIIKQNADKLVELPATSWTSITTEEDLKSAVDAETNISQWTGVSATQTQTYDKVIATQVGSAYYMIHITKGTVDAGAPCGGTSITIDGQEKH
jgi:hypothetical protein